MKAPGRPKIAIVLPAVAFSTSKVFGPIEQPLPSTSTNSCSVPAGSLSPTFDHDASPSVGNQRLGGRIGDAWRPFCTRRVTTHDLVFEIGRLSAISTTSPSLYSPFSSCAWYLLDLGDDLAVELVLGAALDQAR